MDEAVPGSWSVDPATLLGLRLSKAENALARGDFDAALVEAEELLDDHPAHSRALQLCAQSSLGMGDSLTALAALTRYVELHTPDATTLVTLAAARFECVDFPGALAAAGQATTLDTQLPEAWYYQGLAAERTGHLDDAAEHFQRAAELAEGRLPTPRAYAELPWSKILKTALASLPKVLQDFYENIPFRWDDFPAVEDLLEHYPPLSPFTDALYRGQPKPEVDPWNQRPESMHLFRANLARAVEHEADIPEQLARALLHEAGHWLGPASDPAWFASP
jgi:tetratricopeptide (TPR) repeat protein